MKAFRGASKSASPHSDRLQVCWSTEALLLPLNWETLTWEQPKHTVQGKLRWGIYVKEEGQRFWKKIDANGQFVNTLPQNVNCRQYKHLSRPHRKTRTEFKEATQNDAWQLLHLSQWTHWTGLKFLLEHFLFAVSVRGGGGSFVSGKCTWTPPHQLPICYEALVTIWSLWGALLQFKWVSDREKTISGANNAAQMKNVLIFEAALWQKQWQWWSQCQLFSFKCHLSSMSFFCSGGMQAWCWLFATIDHWFYSKWKACQKTRNSGIY